MLYHTYANKSRHSLVYLNDASPCGDMMYLLCKYDVARFTRNDAIFAIMCRQAHIIRRSRHHRATPYIICRRQTSFKKRTFVSRQKCVFCCLKGEKRSTGVGKTEKRSTFSSAAFSTNWNWTIILLCVRKYSNHRFRNFV